MQLPTITIPDLPTRKKKEEDPPVNCGKKLKLFLSAHWAGLLAFFTPIIALPILFSSGTFPIAQHLWCGYCLIVMAVYWMTECIPLPITSFIPVIVFPMTGVMDTKTTCACYVNDTIFMFLGSLMLATCVEQSGFHVRLALCAIRCIGYSHRKLLFAMSFITMFVSMWIANTAATTMMVPINFALLRVFESLNLLKIYEKNAGGDLEASDTTTCYFCSVTYAATLGGIGTLVGTGTNLVFKGHFIKDYPNAPELLSFPLFSAFSIPLMLALEASFYLFMIFYYFGFLRPNSAKAKASVIPQEGLDAAKETVMNDTKKIGSMTYWEYMVVLLFGGAMIGFFARSPEIFPGWGDMIVEYFGIKNKKFIKDSACAMIVAFFMMSLPSNTSIFNNCKAKFKEELPKNGVKSVLDWKACHDSMPWSYAFLLGGGFALSTAAKPEYSNLNGKLGDFLAKMAGLPDMVILLLVIAFTIFVTNFASNVATCNVVTPIAMQMAKQLKLNPLQYNLATGIAASFCFVLPVGTPGNLIVQSAAKITTKKMIVAGSVPTIFSIFITWLFIIGWAPLIWSTDGIVGFPSWAAAPGKEEALAK